MRDALLSYETQPVSDLKHPRTKAPKHREPLEWLLFTDGILLLLSGYGWIDVGYFVIGKQGSLKGIYVTSNIYSLVFHPYKRPPKCSERPAW